MSKCDELPVLDIEVPGCGKSLDLVLKPLNPGDDGKPQYWPLFNQDSPDEHFGNMRFRFCGERGLVKLNITLDLSEVPGRELEFSHCWRNGLDGIIALSPDFKHQFWARARWTPQGYTKLVIWIRDREEIPDNFSFLWLCEDVESGMHFVSGDPQAQIDPR